MADIFCDRNEENGAAENVAAVTENRTSDGRVSEIPEVQTSTAESNTAQTAAENRAAVSAVKYRAAGCVKNGASGRSA